MESEISSPPCKGRQEEGAQRLSAPQAWPGSWQRNRRLGQPFAGPDPRPLRPCSSGAGSLHPERLGEDDPAALAAPQSQEPLGGSTPGPAGGCCPYAGWQRREAKSLAVGTRQQPGRKRPPTHSGAARRTRLRQTGEPGWLAQPSGPRPPGGNSPFSFRPSAAPRLPSGPL